MSYLKKAKEFQNMQMQGQTMEAFEKYYADNCKIIEMPSGEIREGKKAQRKAIQDWFGMVEEIHGGGVNSITANEEDGVTCCETWTDVTFKGAGRTKMKEVGIQKWEGDQIVEERFYYHMPQEG
jgi:ketosteroid isomerase-like protein